MHADEALTTRSTGIVTVEDPVDITTAQGRAFVQILAVFGEIGVATILARVQAARTYVIKAERVVAAQPRTAGDPTRLLCP